MANAIENTVQEARAEPVRLSEQELTRQEERYAAPPVDIYETEEGLTVLADLPGVSPSGLSIHVERGILTIEGKIDAGSRGALLSHEFDLTSFYRQFRVAETIDTEKIRATLKHGVLHLALPKLEKAKPRQIPVQSA
ncbi:MAG: Hsp20/alpha crystallin family protein [Deltaproteobacteria bacterium]|nr:Hsp20/alpha crystallin family protein [Deltaproteobacteria bacterium]